MTRSFLVAKPDSRGRVLIENLTPAIRFLLKFAKKSVEGEEEAASASQAPDNADADNADNDEDDEDSLQSQRPSIEFSAFLLEVLQCRTFKIVGARKWKL